MLHLLSFMVLSTTSLTTCHDILCFGGKWRLVAFTYTLGKFRIIQSWGEMGDNAEQQRTPVIVRSLPISLASIALYF